jgi:hypothetical protein
MGVSYHVLAALIPRKIIPFHRGNKMAEYKSEEENCDTSTGEFISVTEAQ